MLKGTMPESDGPGTVVGVNVALSGTLKDQNDISVHGMVEGEVVSEKTVTVGQSAQVKGPVRGKVITVAGVVRGSIDASEKLEVLETGKIFGSVTTRDMVVRSGAQISGKITMGMDEDEAAKADPEESLPEPIAEPADTTEATPGEEPILKPDEE
ncbi:MAG: polymer-forming cytoskeletal protein [Patescibacteria group bacterium]